MTVSSPLAVPRQFVCAILFSVYGTERACWGPCIPRGLLRPPPCASCCLAVQSTYLVNHQGHILQVAGLAGDHPPTDEEGYLEFARSLPSPEIYQALTQAKPLGPIYVFNRTENVKRSYGQVRLPD